MIYTFLPSKYLQMIGMLLVLQWLHLKNEKLMDTNIALNHDLTKAKAINKPNPAKFDYVQACSFILSTLKNIFKFVYWEIWWA